jgi:hypothetical protein
MPKDQLKFEHESREREISSIRQENQSTRMEISRLRREAKEMSDFADEMRRRNRGAYDEAGSLADGSDLARHANQLAEQVRDSEGTILELKNEIAAIHEVLNAKWANA